MNGFSEAEIQHAARTLAKKLLNIILNASSEATSKKAIGRLISGWRKRNGHRIQNHRDAQLYATVVSAICRTDVAGIVDALKIIHQPIAHRFFTGIGSRLQATVDGPLMLNILGRLMQANIPALSLHDAVLCRLRDAAAVEAMMRERYRLRFGFLPVIKASSNRAVSCGT